MKFSKIFFSLAFVLFGTLAIAQSNQQQAMEEVGLTEEEIAEVKSADKEYKKAAKAVKANDKVDRKEQGKQLKDLNEKRKEKIATIMGEERYKKFKELTVEKRKATKGQRDAAMAELNLSDEQETQLKEVKDKYRKAAVELRMDSKLSVEDKRAKAKELRKAQNADMKAIFTPEQYEKYQEMKKEKSKQ